MSVEAAYSEIPANFILEQTKNLVVKAQPLLKPIHQFIYNQFPNQTELLYQWVASIKSPLSEDLPLMDPIVVLTIALSYLAIVFLGRSIGSALPKFQAKGISMIHNFVMVLLSAYMCYGVIVQSFNDGYTWFGNPADHSESGLPMAKIIAVFYISKIPEFVDTMIMILKQNYRQISFLHVYHHASIFLIWYVVTLMAPNGDAYFSAALNSFIHVVMYGYYLLSGLGIKSVSAIKKFITIGQMTQFALNFVQATYNLVDGYFLRPQDQNTPKMYPIGLSVLLWFYMISMLVLFYNFFVQDRKRQAAARKLGGGSAKKIN